MYSDSVLDESQRSKAESIFFGMAALPVTQCESGRLTFDSAAILSFQKCLKSGQQTAATLCKMTASPYTVEDSGTLRIHSSAEPGVRSTGFVCQKQSDLWLSPKKKSIRKGEKVKFTFAKKMGLG